MKKNLILSASLFILINCVSFAQTSSTPKVYPDKVVTIESVNARLKTDPNKVAMAGVANWVFTFMCNDKQTSINFLESMNKTSGKNIATLGYESGIYTCNIMDNAQYSAQQLLNRINDLKATAKTFGAITFYDYNIK